MTEAHILKEVKATAILLGLLLATHIVFGETKASQYLRYAIECTEKQDYVGAIALCNMAVSIDSTYDLAYYHRAYNRLMINDKEGAIEDATKAINLNSNLADAYVLRAEAKLKKGERFSAISDYNRARRIDSTGTLARFASNIIQAIIAR